MFCMCINIELVLRECELPLLAAALVCTVHVMWHIRSRSVVYTVRDLYQASADAPEPSC